jgi:hypothetical protein
MESVSSAASEGDGPAVGSFNDCSNRSFKCIFEVDRRSRTSFLASSQSRQILLFPFQMKFKRLTCHSVAHAPSGERRSRGASALSRIDLLRGDGGSLSCQAASAFSSTVSSKLSIRVLARSARSASGRASVQRPRVASEFLLDFHCTLTK